MIMEEVFIDVFFNCQQGISWKKILAKLTVSSTERRDSFDKLVFCLLVSGFSCILSVRTA